METQKYVYASLDDVIFEGRNRAYGAYVLRKLYNENLGKGLTLAIAIFILFLSIPLAINKIWPQEFVLPQTLPKEETKVELQIFDFKPEQPKAQIADPISAPKATVTDNTATKIVSDIKFKPVKPAIDNPPGTEIGATNQTGNNGNQAVIDDTGTGTGNSLSVTTPPTGIEIYADKMPEFPGGEAALSKYLSNNIKFTKTAERLRLAGLVVVSFVVNYEGNITDIKILKGLGGGLDEEAMRVVKAMPKWQPGKNNGNPVNVRYNLPVRFTVAN